MPKYFYTKKQLQVEKWINEIGFVTELEVPIGPFCMDIFVPELNMCVEIDGPYHMKKKDKQRDEYFELGNIQVIRFKSDVTKEKVFEYFNDYIKENS